MSSRNFTSGIILVLFLFLWSADAAFGANCEWIGRGPNNRWSTAANWQACNNAAPKNGDNLIFHRIEQQMANENDIPGLSVGTITFWEPTDEPHEISGLPVTVTTTVRVRDEPQAGHEVILRLPMVMGPNSTITLDTPELRLSMRGPLTAISFLVNGRGTLELFNVANDWSTLRLTDATLRLGAPGAVPIRTINMDGTATLDLNDLNTTMGRLVGNLNAAARIRLGAATLTIEQDQAAVFIGTISGSGGLVKNGPGRLVLRRSLFLPGANTYTGTTTVNAGTLELAHDDNTVCIPGPLVINGGSVSFAGDHEIADTAPVTVNAPGRLSLTGFRDTIGSLSGNGAVQLGMGTGALSIGGDNISTTFTGTFSAFPATPGVELLNEVRDGHAHTHG